MSLDECGISSNVNEAQKKICEIRIDNFKAFGHEQRIPIKPISLIYGSNSSGKSSILQALLILKQSEYPFDYLVYDGKHVNLASFKNVIHKHDTNLLLEISASSEKNFYMRRWHSLNKKSKKRSVILDGYELLIDENGNLDFTSSLVKKYYDIICNKNSKIIGNAKYFLNEINNLEFKKSGWDNAYINSCNNIENILYKFKHAGVLDLNTLIILTALLSKPKFSVLADPGEFKNVKSLSYNFNNQLDNQINIAKSLDENVHKLINELEYIGPLRQFPERYYLKDVNFTDSVGVKGEYIADMLSADKNKLDSLNEWFDKLGLDYHADIKKLAEDDVSLYFLKLMDKRNGVFVSPPDVGFGVSQIMPIIVQAISSINKLILIEQPEIHLHPKLQAEMADLFISSAKSSNNNTFIIETHSEHLLLRIMRRIRETTTGKLTDQSLALTPEDVSVLYVESVDGESIVREMPLNEYGELVKPWPGGFFEEGLREVF